MPNGIIWPPRFDPKVAPVFVSNCIDLAVSADTVWQKLICATGWPSFYPNASNVAIDGGGETLGPGSVFRWRTFGVDLLTTVEEFVPGERIAWRAKGLGVDAWHAWLITPTATGCHIRTEETQHGALARLGKLFMPNRMHAQHQLWLEGLGRASH